MKLNKYFLIISSLLFILISCEQSKSALRIKADKKDAVVFLNGEKVGNVPLDIMVSKGTYTIEIIKERENENFYHYYYKETKTIGSNVAMKINANLSNTKIEEKDAWNIVKKENDLIVYSEYMELFNERKYIEKALEKSKEIGIVKMKIENKYYKVVLIGEQIWMAENLEFGNKNVRWYDKKKKNMFYNIWDIEKIDEKIKGWHMPSDNEWKELEKFLGMPESELNRFGKRGSIGSKLKIENWNKSNNLSGFSAIPIGYWGGDLEDEFYADFGNGAYFWATSKMPENYVDYDDRPIVRVIKNNTIERYRVHPKYTFVSVRMIKDKQ